jgi:hypothetical protein
MEWVIYNIYNMDKKYKSIMIKSDLKDLMDKQIIKIGKKMSYTQLIEILIENYNQNENL